jgi:hypothetical protein
MVMRHVDKLEPRRRPPRGKKGNDNASWFVMTCEAIGCDPSPKQPRSQWEPGCCKARSLS